MAESTGMKNLKSRRLYLQGLRRNQKLHRKKSPVAR